MSDPCSRIVRMRGAAGGLKRVRLPSLSGPACHGEVQMPRLAHPLATRPLASSHQGAASLRERTLMGLHSKRRPAVIHFDHLVVIGVGRHPNR